MKTDVSAIYAERFLAGSGAHAVRSGPAAGDELWFSDSAPDGSS